MTDLGDLMAGEAPEVQEVAGLGGANNPGQGIGAQKRLQWICKVQQLAQQSIEFNQFADIILDFSTA